MELIEKLKTNYEFEPPFTTTQDFKEREQSLQANRLNHIEQYTIETFEGIVKESDLLKPRLLNKKIDYLEEKYIDILNNPDIPSEQKIVLLESSEYIIDSQIKNINENTFFKKGNKVLESKNSLRDFKEKVKNARKAEVLLSNGQEILDASIVVNKTYPGMKEFVDFKLDTSCNKPTCLYQLVDTIIKMPGENSSFYNKELNSPSREIIAEHLNISENEVTESQIKAFIFLHEMGHAYDLRYNFIPKYPSKREALDMLLKRNQENLEKLPIKTRGQEFKEICKKLKSGILKLEEIDGLDEKYKKMEVKDFLVLQNDMTRNLPEEVVTNQFAAKIMTDNWNMFNSK